jgi:AAA+ ATPase superfamily predicted ATPase
MNKLHNPFVLFGYAGEEYFCDRKEETQELISALRNGRNITLRSPRRIGKTGLIQHVFQQLKKTNPAVKCFYVDLFSTNTLDDFVIAFGKAVIGQLDTPLQKMENYVVSFFKSCRLYFSADPLTGNPKLGIDLVAENASVTLDEIFAYIRKSGQECYIAFDEFQQITEYPQKGIEALLRTHVQQCPNIRFIFSGSKQHLMSEMFTSPKRPFFRSTDKMNLDIIPESAYFDFANKWLWTIDSSLSEEVFHTIYTMVSGYTGYIQKVLNRLFELRLEEITDDHVKQCIDYIIQREEDDFRRLYSLLTTNQAQVLKAIAHEKMVAAPTSQAFIQKYNLPASSSVKRAIDFLIDNEYIYPTEDGYIVYERFMAIWLQRL